MFEKIPVDGMKDIHMLLWSPASHLGTERDGNPILVEPQI